MSEKPARRSPEADRLAVIEDQTRMTLELVRSLVQLLLPREGGRDGPSLEDLIAALVAQQRDTLVSVRRLQADLAALCDHLLGGKQPAQKDGAAADGVARA
ncbi:MAG TPA: hypothetical protein VJ739_07325 [Gemmataceae bacterium]|nr:hypothetical protein [Gemmataceae bacterium]